MSEKRKFMRFDLLMDAIWAKGGVNKKIKISNFCREGMGILSREPIREGDDIELELTLPGDNIPVLLEGKVAWANGPVSDDSQHRGGVRFNKVESGDRGRILEYIYHKWIRPASADVK